MNEHWLRRLEQAATDEEKTALIPLMTLENQPEAARRAARAAAVPHWFDAAVLAALLNPTLSDTSDVSDNLAQDSFAAVYATLQTLPFAQRYGESGHALHDLTRAGLIGYLLREQPDDFRAYSRRAARFFAERDAIECVYHLLASDTAAESAGLKS